MTCGVGAGRTRTKSLCVVVGGLAPSHISTLPSFPEHGTGVSNPLTRNSEVSECFIPLPLGIVHGLLGGGTRTVEDIASFLQVAVPRRDFADIVVEPLFAQPTAVGIVQNKAELLVVPPLSRSRCGAFRWVVNRGAHPGNLTFWRCGRCLCPGHRTSKR